MDIQIIITQMSILFILLAAGYLIGKLKILTSEGNRIFTRIVLYVALPCTILNSVFSTRLEITAGELLYKLLICFLSFAIAFAIAIPAIRLTRSSKENRGMLTFMSIFSNCGFMGFPVTLAVFGASAGLYTALFNIPFNLLSFSVGIMLVAGGCRKMSPKLLLNPPLIASILAIPAALTGFNPPYAVTEAVRLTGGITTPGAMIVIGVTLANIPIRSIFSEWRVWAVSVLRLIIIPVVTWLIFRFFITDEVMLGVLVVLSAMPVAAQSAMFAVQYDGNEKTASSGVFITTVLCVLTVPLLVYLLLMQ